MVAGKSLTLRKFWLTYANRDLCGSQLLWPVARGINFENAGLCTDPTSQNVCSCERIFSSREWVEINDFSIPRWITPNEMLHPSLCKMIIVSYWKYGCYNSLRPILNPGRLACTIWCSIDLSISWLLSGLRYSMLLAYLLTEWTSSANQGHITFKSLANMVK